MKKGLDCQRCSGSLRKVRGCNGFGKKVVIFGVEVDRCPMAIPGVRRAMVYLEGYRMMRLGFLPCDGGWLNQAGKFLDAVKVIEEALEELSDGE